VVTSTLVFEGGGQLIEYAGGYDDWLLQKPKMQEKPSPAVGANKKSKRQPPPGETRRLGYMERRELTNLPQKIEGLELEQKDLYAVMSDPLFFKKEKKEITRIQTRLAQVEQDIQTAYRRWEELEGIECGP
jgi:ATP-binding cassette subfamily F protein uup